MKTRATVILGVCFCIVGLALIITAHTGSTWQKATVEDLNFEFIYPSGWTKTQKWETLSYPATDEQPASSIDHFVIDLLDRGNTIHIRINFFRTDAPTSGQQVAEAISKVNARNKDYRLLELKDVIVGGQAAVRMTCRENYTQVK